MLWILSEELFKEQFEIMFKAWVEIVKMMFELTKKTKFDGEMIGYTEELLTFLVRDFFNGIFKSKVIPKMPICMSFLRKTTKRLVALIMMKIDPLRLNKLALLRC
ncbi:hypothetical protein HSHS1_12990 [Helicobacter suis HS1]|nr:hypothetical protein [Helicobacter suis]BDR28538.1 hypothetical protein HSHS1_12990 [Helicobacter suis HS1]